MVLSTAAPPAGRFWVRFWFPQSWLLLAIGRTRLLVQYMLNWGVSKEIWRWCEYTNDTSYGECRRRRDQSRLQIVCHGDSPGPAQNVLGNSPNLQLTFELKWDELGAECTKSNLGSAQAEAEMESRAGDQENAGAQRRSGVQTAAAAAAVNSCTHSRWLQPGETASDTVHTKPDRHS